MQLKASNITGQMEEEKEKDDNSEIEILQKKSGHPQWIEPVNPRKTPKGFYN